MCVYVCECSFVCMCACVKGALRMMIPRWFGEKQIDKERKTHTHENREKSTERERDRRNDSSDIAQWTVVDY